MARRLPVLLFLFLGGVACIIASVVTGEGEAGIFIVFPFVVGTGWLMLLGILLVFLSVVAFMYTALPAGDSEWMPPGQEPRHSEKKAGGLILIGPLPIVIASDKKLALALLVLGIILTVAFLTFFWILA